MKKIEIILADADSLFTDALRAALRGVEDFEVSAADGGAAGLREVFVRGQGIVVIHRQIPDAETIHMLREGKRDRKELRALLIVKEPTGDLLSLAGENVGIGVMSSSSDIEELVSALRSLARGERYVSKKVLAAAGGRSGAELIYHNEGYQEYALNSVSSVQGNSYNFNYKITNETAFHAYLSGLTFYDLTGNYSFSSSGTTFVYILDTPDGMLGITLYDNAMKLTPLYEENPVTSCYYYIE